MIRLNLAAGDDHRAGYLSVDLREDVADIVCDVTKLEHWGDATVSEILALDILEHFPVFRTADILAEWNRVLVEGGILVVKVPNLKAIAHLLLARDTSTDMLVRNIYGGHRWGPEGSWDAHHTGWTPKTLERDLEAAGFTVVNNDIALNMTCVCEKT